MRRRCYSTQKVPGVLYGAATMTTSVFNSDDSYKSNMWSVLRCSRTTQVLFLVYVIAFHYYVYYHVLNRWQDVREELEALHDRAAMIHNAVSTLERSSVAMENTLQMLDDKHPIIYAITPTFARPVQKAELTRLSQTFLHVPTFHWIVVEDSEKKTDLVTRFLASCGLTYTHLAVVTPQNYKLGKNDPNWKKPRGVEQRNAALRWLRENRKPGDKGIVYFADDDNTYSIQLFKEMEKIRKVGVWPVGLVGGLMVEKPICDNATKRVIGFNALWKPDRPFPLDMAGFAINLSLVLEKKDAWFSYDVQSGYQESEILRQMVTKSELEPLASCCTKVYVWHTRTEPPHLNVENILQKKGKRSNFGIEV